MLGRRDAEQDPPVWQLGAPYRVIQSVPNLDHQSERQIPNDLSTLFQSFIF